MILADGDSPMKLTNLASISGIIAASMLIVQIIKRLIPAGSAIAKVPIFIWAILSSIGLATLANKVLKLNDGSPMLEGDYWKVLWAAITAAAGASGFFTWVYNPENVQSVKLDPTNNDFGGKMTEKDQKSLAEKLPNPLILLPLLICLIGLGCVCPEKAILREGMDGLTKSIRTQHRDWANKLVVDPATGKDHRDQLPTITPAQLDQINKTHDEYDNLVKEDRERDAQGLFGGNK